LLVVKQIEKQERTLKINSYYLHFWPNPILKIVNSHVEGEACRYVVIAIIISITKEKKKKRKKIF